MLPSLPAQSKESDLAPAPGEFTADPLPPPAEPFFIPDAPDDALPEVTATPKRWFTLKMGLSVLVDYSAFSQDAASVGQVGTQEDQWEARSARAMFRGTLGYDRQVSYLFAAEYNGFGTEPGETWSLSDLSVSFPLRGPGTKLTLGKTKEPFSYEMVGDSANLPQSERVLNPFFVSRSIGAKVSQVLGEKHNATAALGIFNDAWATGESLSEGGTDVAARVTRLLWDDPARQKFLHLGLAARYVGADHSTLRYKGRPESNVTDTYVDTGNFSADHAWHLGLEALWNQGPFSVLAEYARAWVDSPTSGDPSFSGYYLTGSWVLTGETRPYDRTVGYARRVMPKGRWGAPELVVRFSHVDLDDGVVQGGSFDKTYLGVNWWATRRWKLGTGWGRTWLDKNNTRGVTDSYLTRMQWIY